MPMLTLGLRLNEMSAVVGLSVNNICITNIGNDGTWYGYSEGVFGTINPGSTIGGINVHDMRTKADGTFVLKFGPTGNEKIENVDYIHLRSSQIPATGIAAWDDANKEYSFVEIEFYDEMISGITEICFYGEFVPVTLIKYDFSEILVGEKI